MNKALTVALLAASALSVAACGSTKAKREANPGICPNALVLADAARLVEFEGEAAAENIAYSAEIENIELTCRFYGERPIEASVDIDFAFGRGPKGAVRDHNFTYFVAVTRTNLEVIEKAEYTIPVRFDEDDPVETLSENIEQIVIPRANETTAGTNFEIVVGFSLTPEQVIYNRSGKSLKFPEIK